VKINFNEKFHNLNGKPIMNPPDPNNPKKKPKPLTLKDVAITALLSPHTQERIEGEKKLQQWENAKLIYKGGKINFKVEDIAELKKLINETYPSPLIVGQAFLMLEKGESQESK